MATISDLANKGAAQSAGYIYTSASAVDGTWYTTIEKNLSGPNGDPDDAAFRAYAYGFDTQANAEAQALRALNGQRKHRYGGGDLEPDGATADPMDNEGHAVTVDQT
jgi:hypothetical protein